MLQNPNLHDAAGRLTGETKGGISTAYAYDENGNSTSIEAYEQITENGNTNQVPVSYMTMTYDPLNRMTKAQKDGMTAEYTYGIDNMRKSKTVNGVTTNYLWDGGNIVAEADGNNEITNRYFRGIGLIASKTDDNLSYYQTDSHGDVSKWGTVDYSYDAFGNETTASNGTNPFRYNGEYHDEETGFIYLRNRYYDPKIGRFINEDPIRDGLNWYVYANSNPVMFVDPSGKSASGIGITAYAAFGIRIDLQGYYVWDDNGNKGIIVVAGGGGGTPNAGVSGTGFTNFSADTIFDLEGMSVGVGGGVSYFGGDVNGDLGGGSLSAGIGVLPVELHGVVTFGKILFNW